MSSFLKLNGETKCRWFQRPPDHAENTYTCTWLHCGSYRPCSSIRADLLILPSSLPSYSPVSLPQVPPVVQSIIGISTSYLLHCAMATSHSISPTTTTPLVLQSRPFTNHAGAMMARLYIPHSICSWHSCITFALLTPFLSAFALSPPLSSLSLLCAPLC